MFYPYSQSEFREPELGIELKPHDLLNGIHHQRCGLPSGKHTNNHGKSPVLMGKSTISTGPFSIAMLCYVQLEGNHGYIPNRVYSQL